MNNAEFTPGPWKVLAAEFTDKGVSYEIEMPEHIMNTADAALIEAAPELYAVLEELEESSSYWSEYYVPLGIVERIKAALCKARGEDNDIKTKVLKWFATGRVGESSRVMALVACGLKDLLKGYDVPEDPGDFNRCLLLLDAVPEIRAKMDDIAALGGRWAKLVPRWAEIEKCFKDEAGPNWAFSDSAPRTYKLMKEVYQ